MRPTTLKRVQGVAIFLVFLALIWTIYYYYSSGIKRKSTVDLRSQQTEFQKRNWLNKISFELISSELQASLDRMNEVVNHFSTQTDKREIKSGYGVFVFSMEKIKLNSLRTELSGIGKIGSEVELVDTSLVNTNEQIENANLASYEKDLAELDKIRVPSDQELRRKESLRAQIRRSQQKLDDLKRSDSYLVYVSILPHGQKLGFLKNASSIGIYFFSVLGFLFVAAILIYYGTRLLMYLLALMGIKGFGQGGITGPYQYGGYGSYQGKYYSRSGYNRGKRKVKRVYKEKESTPNEEDTKS